MSESAGKPKKKGCLFWALIILAGLVGLSVLSSLGGGGGETNSSSAGSGVASPDETANDSRGGEQALEDSGTESPSASATVGKAARDGDFEFTVKGIDCGEKTLGSSSFGASADGEFCLVKLKVENIGTSAGYFEASNQKALDATGRTFSADGEAGAYVQGNNSIWEQINPGNSVTGTVVFDVPAKTKLTAVELHDSMFSGGVKVALK